HEATAFVSSSRKEPFGVVITEALCCGLPIVVTKSGGPEDIVNETNGYLAENKNASSLHAKMQLMIDNINNFDSKLISKVALNTYSEKVIS
ncbi:MAG: glycosyltransferase family 4 protein, partial [Chitinophagales bacterium]